MWLFELSSAGGPASPHVTNNEPRYKGCSWGLGEWDESWVGALRSTPLWDAGAGTLAPMIKGVVPKARFPLDCSGSAQLTPPRSSEWAGDMGGAISTDIQSEVILLSFLPGVFQSSSWGLLWAGLSTKVFFLPERSPWIIREMWLSGYQHTSSYPLPSFPHKIRSNAAWDWFVQRAKRPKRLGTAEFTLNLGGGKMSRSGTRGIQSEALKLLCWKKICCPLSSPGM